jgi:hypothetical protein
MDRSRRLGDDRRGGQAAPAGRESPGAEPVSRVHPSRPRGARLVGLAPLFLVTFALGGGVAACADPEHAASPDAAVAAPSAVAVAEAPAEAPAGAPAEVAAGDVPLGHMHLPPAEDVREVWAARPAYVTALPTDWQAAYAYALSRPDVLQWLPCYCGCGGMGHGSNLDCFFQRREEEGNYTWEEHASYCNVCVETANLAARMLSDGASIGAIRDAVDAQFGGGQVPGTDTPRPPAS